MVTLVAVAGWRNSSGERGSSGRGLELGRVEAAIVGAGLSERLGNLLIGQTPLTLHFIYRYSVNAGQPLFEFGVVSLMGEIYATSATV